jgi:hypothetical protein
MKTSGCGGQGSQGASGNMRSFGNDNGTSDLKNELQTGYDVKIGDGMDIGIHGENGKAFEILNIWKYFNILTSMFVSMVYDT